MRSYIQLSSEGAQIVESNRTIRDKKGDSLLELPNSFTIIDIETTGLDPRFDEIIELSAIRVINGEEVEKFSELVNPDYPISNFIKELTGITEEMLSEAEPIDSVLPRYLSFIGDDIVVGYNVHFDVNFIYDNTLKYLNDYFENNLIDVMRFAKLLIKDSKNHQLKTMAEYFSIDYDNLHRGLEDCKVTFFLFKVLRKTISEQFKNETDFLKRHQQGLKAAHITTDITEFDEDNQLFQKKCAFTGTLAHIVRKEAFQIVKDLGGNPQDNVTKKTNYLILGDTDYSKVKDGKSRKLKNVEKYQLEGLDIQIISEQVFYDMIDI